LRRKRKGGAPSRSKIGKNLGAFVTLGAPGQPTKLASIRAEDTDKLGAETRIHERFGGALSHRLIGCYHQARHDAVGELEQVRFATAVLTMDHVDRSEAKIRLSEYGEIPKAEGGEHQWPPGAGSRGWK
jgi:hypothetical protein